MTRGAAIERLAPSIAVGTALAFAGAAPAQQYPAKPIRLVVPLGRRLLRSP